MSRIEPHRQETAQEAAERMTAAIRDAGLAMIQLADRFDRRHPDKQSLGWQHVAEIACAQSVADHVSAIIGRADWPRPETLPADCHATGDTGLRRLRETLLSLFAGGDMTAATIRSLDLVDDPKKLEQEIRRMKRELERGYEEHDGNQD